MNSVLLAGLFLLLSVSAAYGQGTASPAKISIPDTEVVNQEGEHIHFASDLLKGKIAVINTFFTTCEAICPITQEHFSKLAKSLGDRLGGEVVLISISVDPENDTPERMKSWGEKFKVGPGWTLVSGQKTEIVELLKSLGLFAPGIKRHQTGVLIGTQASGWTRASGFVAPDKLEKIIAGVKTPNQKKENAPSSSM